MSDNAVWSVIGMRHFAEHDAKVLGWRYFAEAPVGDVDTCYIVGMYDAPDYDFTLANTRGARRRIIKWCGSDAFMCTRPEMLPEATHLCDSEMVRRHLLTLGIDATVVQAPTQVHAPVTPLPEVPTVSVYFGNTPENYGASIVRFLQEALPDVRWHTYQFGQYDRDGMLDVIDKTTVALRLTSHDGSAVGVREFLEAGRYVVTSQSMPHTRQVSLKDPVGIVRAVRTALANETPHMNAVEYYSVHNSDERFLREFTEATR